MYCKQKLFERGLKMMTARVKIQVLCLLALMFFACTEKKEPQKKEDPRMDISGDILKGDSMIFSALGSKGLACMDCLQKANRDYVICLTNEANKDAVKSACLENLMDAIAACSCPDNKVAAVKTSTKKVIGKSQIDHRKTGEENKTRRQKRSGKEESPAPKVAKSRNGIYVPGTEELFAIRAKYKDITLDKLTEGHTIYTKGACIKCHGALNIYKRHETEWKHIIELMAARAKLSDPEKDAVYKYILAIKATQPKKFN